MSGNGAKAQRLKPKAQDAILDAAETLFGAHGPDGVSLRQIAQAAGSANHYAVQYHFGDKEKLIAALFERRLQSLETRRGVLLAKAVAEGRERDPRALLEVLFAPIADEVDASGRCSYAVFLLGLRVFSEFTKWRTYENSPPLTRNVDHLLRTSLSDLPDEVFFERLSASATAILAAIVDWDRRAADDPRLSGSKERCLQLVLDFAAAGMAAPSS